MTHQKDIAASVELTHRQMNHLNAKEAMAVRELGDRIGYGRLMQLAEQEWREFAASKGLDGSEHTVGTCAAFLVPCPHPIKDSSGHCDICCGSGRITKGVLELYQSHVTLIEAAKKAQPEVITYWDFEDEMEDVTNRDNGKVVSAFLMRRFPNGLRIVKEEQDNVT